MKNYIISGLLLFLAATVLPSRAQEVVDVEGRYSGNLLIPIAINGLSGEAASVLRFDLEVLGFKVVSEAEAKYIITGSTDGALKAQLLTKTKAPMLSQSYSGGTLRTQAHAFAEEVINSLRGKNLSLRNMKIVFRGGGNQVIYHADFDGFNARPLTGNQHLLAAPTMVKGVLYYLSYERNPPSIIAQRVQTGDRKVVAGYSGFNGSPAISPDGSKVAMILSKGGSPDIYVANIDGSNLTQITSTTEDESSPAWSPSGRELVYASRATGKASLYITSLGGGTRKLNTPGQSTEPSWSPDGKWIAYSTQSGGGEICVIAADGKSSTLPLVPGEDPVWAPNSRTLIFTRGSGQAKRLSLLDVPTKQVKDVANFKGSASQPDWVRN